MSLVDLLNDPTMRAELVPIAARTLASMLALALAYLLGSLARHVTR
jgi:hypothetical protein